MVPFVRIVGRGWHAAKLLLTALRSRLLSLRICFVLVPGTPCLNFSELGMVSPEPSTHGHALIK